MASAGKKKALLRRLKKTPGVRNPEALARWIGRKVGGSKEEPKEEAKKHNPFKRFARIGPSIRGRRSVRALKYNCVRKSKYVQTCTGPDGYTFDVRVDPGYKKAYNQQYRAAGNPSWGKLAKGNKMSKKRQKTLGIEMAQLDLPQLAEVQLGLIARGPELRKKSTIQKAIKKLEKFDIHARYSPKKGGSWKLPGDIVIYWDEEDPNEEGWYYRDPAYGRRFKRLLATIPDLEHLLFGVRRKYGKFGRKEGMMQDWNELIEAKGLKRSAIQSSLNKAGIDASYSSREGGHWKLPGGILIYWDAQDPSDEGWAYRIPGEDSGGLDSIRDLKALLQYAKKLGESYNPVPDMFGFEGLWWNHS